MGGAWFKDLSEDNWLSRDGEADTGAGDLDDGPSPRRSGFGRAGGTPAPQTREEWLAAVREPQLLDQVPNEVQRIYKVARGVAAYGYFFHPLMTLAQRELYRAAEAAVRFKFRELDVTPPGLKGSKLARGPSRDPRDFRRMVDFLVSRNAIGAGAAVSWRAITKSRQVVSHPEDGTVFSLATVLTSFGRFAELINGLYGS